jgi:hypothetical protein
MSRFGWIPHNERSPEVKKICNDLIIGMDKFNLIGTPVKFNPQAFLWEYAKTIFGHHLPSFHQFIGSCVGQGATKAVWYLECAEIVRGGQPITSSMPYEPFIYAQSRVCAGISGPSDGSSGVGAATAVKKYGVLDSGVQGLPKWQVAKDEISWPGKIDSQWGMNGAPSQYLPTAKKSLVKTTALLKSVDDAINALQNNFACTVASDWAGRLICDVSGNKNPVLLNQQCSNGWDNDPNMAGGHQMCLAAHWEHPELGNIFNINNSWGPDAHNGGKPNPDDSPPGSFWILPDDLQYMLDQQDSFIYSAFDGFPTNQIVIDKNAFKLI